MGSPEADTTEGSDDDDEEEKAKARSEASSGLFDTAGLSPEELVDEAVTSGGDNNQWIDDDGGEK